MEVFGRRFDERSRKFGSVQGGDKVLDRQGATIYAGQ